MDEAGGGVSGAIDSSVMFPSHAAVFDVWQKCLEDVAGAVCVHESKGMLSNECVSE